MANASVTYNFADGTSVVCEVTTTSEHPDALDQLIRRAFDLYTRVSDYSNDDAETPED